MYNLDHVAMNIGYCFMLMGAAIIGATVLLFAAYLMNRAQHALVDCFDGWGAFKKYREWVNSSNVTTSEK